MSDARPERLWLWKWGAANLLLCLLAYAPALNGGFIWDDVEIYVVKNALLLKPDGLYRIWFTTEPLDYYPLTYTLLWFEWRLWGYEPLGYHLVNVAIHAFGATMLAWTLRQLGLPGAGLAGLLFALHPVCVEAAAWISQLKTLLGAALAFAAFGCYLKRDACGGIGWSAAAWLLFALSLAGKPVAILLPFALLGYGWWKYGRIDARAIRRSVPFFALALLFGAIGVWFQQVNAIGGMVVREQTPLARLLTVAWAICFYVWKAILPIGLMFVYPRWNVDPRMVSTYIPVVLLSAAAAWFWRRRRGWGRHALAALGWFVLMVLPGSGLVDVVYWRFTYVGDHYQYPALPAVVAAATATGVVLMRKARRGRDLLGRFAAVSAALLLGVGTALQARNYRSEQKLWEATLERNPDAWVAHTCLGVLLRAQGETAGALRHFDEAYKLRPDLAESHSNRGLTLTRLGRPPEALEAFREAVRLNPGNSTFRQNFAAALARLGRTEEALLAFQTAQTLADEQRWSGPRNVRPLIEQGFLLAQLGRNEESLAAFEEVLRRQPGDSLAYDGEGRTYQRMGRWKEALACFCAAVAADSRNLTAAHHLGVAMYHQGNETAAAAAFRLAAPSVPDAACALTWLLAASADESVRRPAEAMVWADRLNPVGAAAAKSWDAYSVALAAAGRFEEAIRANEQARAAASASNGPEGLAIIERLQSRNALFKRRQSFIGRLEESVGDLPPAAPR